MNWLCKILGCPKPSCTQAVEAMKTLMQAKCETQKIRLRNNYKGKIKGLNFKIHLLNQKIGMRDVEIEYLQAKLDDCMKQKAPPKLSIRNETLYFGNGGTEKFLGVGVWRREALALETGQHGYTWDKCGDDYSLAWAENEFHKYHLNYLRTDICNNTSLVKAFCERMYKKGVVVELTLQDGDRNNGDIMAVVEATKHLPNIIYEVWNEMYSMDDVHRAINLAHTLKTMGGLIVSGGAIGNGGEKWAEEARKQGLYNIVDIIQVHRHWPYPNHEDNDWILHYKLGKVMGRNEFFDRKKLGLSGTEFVFKKSIEHGASLINYYGFRMPGFGSRCGEDVEGNPYWKYLEIASKILKEEE